MPQHDKGAMSGPPPKRADLHQAAVAHLARFAASEAGLVAVLLRRVDRWARAARQSQQDPDAVRDATGAAGATAREVARSLVEAGAVDDAGFAEARARSLARAGRSKRATLAYLLSKGVAPDLAAQALPEPEREFAAALAYARRRRIGPYRTGAATPESRQKELGMLARAGFPADIADRMLATGAAEADATINRLRQA